MESIPSNSPCLRARGGHSNTCRIYLQTRVTASLWLPKTAYDRACDYANCRWPYDRRKMPLWLHDFLIVCRVIQLATPMPHLHQPCTSPVVVPKYGAHWNGHPLTGLFPTFLAPGWLSNTLFIVPGGWCTRRSPAVNNVVGSSLLTVLRGLSWNVPLTTSWVAQPGWLRYVMGSQETRL